MHTDEPILRLAAEQHGVMSRAQLLEEGMTPRMIERRVASGQLLRLHLGVYIAGHLGGSLEPPRAKEMAALLACGPGAVLSHRTAASLWELVPSPPPGSPVDVAVPTGRAPSRRRGIRGHRVGALESGDIRVVDRLPLTSPERTLRDLAAVTGPEELERATARAQRRGLVQLEGLKRQIAAGANHRGMPLLRMVVEQEGGPALTRSEAEARFLGLVRGSGLSAPETNVVVHGYELDFFWRAERVAVEVDGFAYHSGLRSFNGDRGRDADLLARGVRVMRVTWDQIVDEPKPTLVRLAQALAR